MADPVIYIRNPSMNFGAALSDAIIDDLRQFVAIGDAGFEVTIERLASGPRFVAKDDVEALFGPASQEVVVRIIRWVTRTGLAEVSPADLQHHLGRIQNEESQPAFSPEQLEFSVIELPSFRSRSVCSGRRKRNRYPRPPDNVSKSYKSFATSDPCLTKNGRPLRDFCLSRRSRWFAKASMDYR